MINKLLFYVVIALMLLPVSCRRPKPKLAEMVMSVKVQVAEYTDNATAQHYIGTLKESKSVALSFAVPGTVRSVNCVEGQYVTKGTVLATLEDASSQSTHEAAQAALRQAQDAYDRMKRVYEKGGITELQWIDIQTKLAQAKSTAAIAGRNLANCELTAPTDGVIGKSNVEPGMNVAPGVTQMTLLNVNPMTVTVPVPDNVITTLSIGRKVMVDFSKLSPQFFTEPYSAPITRKGVVSSPLSHNYTIDLTVTNPHHVLLPGMVCDVYISSTDSARAIVLPAQSVKLSDEGTHFVWIADDSTATKRMVQIGNLAPDGIVITEGLQPGDKVIVEGEQKVSEGTKIKIL